MNRRTDEQWPIISDFGNSHSLNYHTIHSIGDLPKSSGLYICRMKLMKEEQRISIVENDAVARLTKTRKRSSRRYSMRLFASAGFILRIRKTLVLFLALATLTFTLCMLAPGNQDLKGQQTNQSKSKNNSDSVLRN